MPERRRLSFDGIEAIMPEVDRLMAGHITVGGWSLGAILDHLARSINIVLDSPASDAPPSREQAVKCRFFFRAPGFPEGQTPPVPELIPNPDADPIVTSESLRAALARFAAHDGPFAAHPVLGPLTRDQWLTFHGRHAAHHLSFAVPT